MGETAVIGAFCSVAEQQASGVADGWKSKNTKYDSRPVQILGRKAEE